MYSPFSVVRLAIFRAVERSVNWGVGGQSVIEVHLLDQVLLLFLKKWKGWWRKRDGQVGPHLLIPLTPALRF